MRARSFLRKASLWTVAAICCIAFTACDSTDSGGEGSVTVEGQATDNDGYGKKAVTIEGATVTAANIDSEGNTQTLSATTETNASGEFSLDVNEPSPLIMVKAEKEDYSSSALVYTDVESEAQVQAQPINVETDAESSVYVDARSDGGDNVTVADVALYVDQQVAGHIESGATSSSGVAATLTASINTETSYISESDEAGDDAVEQSSQSKVDAFAQVQADLAGAGDSSAENDIMTSFEQSIHDAYLSAEIPAEVYAKARQSANAAVHLETNDVGSSSDAGFGLRQQSEVSTAVAVANSIEASFESAGASQSQLDALADARSQLVADLRGASSVEAMALAKADYEEAVETELAAALEVDADAIAAAEDALTEAMATLEAALTIDVSAGANAEAHSTFYTSAESTVEAALESSQNAEMGATVVTLLAVQ